jgi:3-oxoacyl-[acyl-carrier protein] reductase
MKKKTVVITGSTSGIGKGIALRLARDQHAIVLNYANDDQRAQETFHLIESIGAQVHLVKANVAKRTDTVRLIEDCVQHFGSIDVLINNAASVADKPMLEMSEEEWDQVIDVNLKGTFLCSQAAATFMLQQEEGGLIINIGASTGIRARKNGVNTCASKAGVMIVTQSLALELGPKVRANTIIPGLTYTEETEHRFHLDDPSVLQERTQQIPLRRIGTPEDIANVIALLLADEASFITGQKIVVDGGQYMW